MADARSEGTGSSPAAAAHQETHHNQLMRNEPTLPSTTSSAPTSTSFLHQQLTMAVPMASTGAIPDRTPMGANAMHYGDDTVVRKPTSSPSASSSSTASTVGATAVGGAEKPTNDGSGNEEKLIPIHCIVATVEIDANGNCIDQDDKEDECNNNHVDKNVDEASSDDPIQKTGHQRKTSMVDDTYLVIPNETPFADLVPTALAKIGYSSSECVYATGSIVVKNWKPLGLQEISASKKATVGDMLSELTTVVTLSIKVYRRSTSSWLESVREKLATLALAFVSAQNAFGNSECPVDQATLTNILDGTVDPRLAGAITEEAKSKLDSWLTHQLGQMSLVKQQMLGKSAAGDAAPAVLPSHPSPPQTSPGSSRLSANSVNQLTPPHHPALPSPRLIRPVGQHPSQVASMWHHPPGVVTPQHAAIAPGGFPHLIPNGAQDFELKQVPTGPQIQRVRVRTSFDAELELPKLQKWFAENPHPTKNQIQEYVRVLNAQESRRGRKQLDVTNVMYWFKNARAAHKRAEVRHCHVGRSPGGLSTASHSNDQLQFTPPMMASGTKRSFNMAGLSPGSDLGNGSFSQDTSNRSDDELEMTDIEDPEDAEPEGQSVRVEAEPDLRHLRGSLDNSKNSAEDLMMDDEEDDFDDLDDDFDEKSHMLGDSSSMPIEGRMPQAVFPGGSHHQSLQEDYMRRLAAAAGNFPQHHQIAFMNSRISAAAAAALMANPYVQHSLANMSGVDLTTAQEAMNFGTSRLGQQQLSPDLPLNLRHHGASAAAAAEERKKRNRTFIDPVSEVPRLEEWFCGNSHPSHTMILRFTQELNSMAYRQKFPKLEAKNVQFWFKNRRAKCKRMKMTV